MSPALANRDAPVRHCWLAAKARAMVTANHLIKLDMLPSGRTVKHPAFLIALHFWSGMHPV